MKYLIETYGCQLNTAESNAIEILLKGRGLESTDNPDEADAVIINTCSVRKTAENRIWGRLGFYHAIKKRKNLILIVTGCMASRLRDELKKEAPFVDFVATNEEKDSIASFISGEEKKDEEKYSFLSSYYKPGEFSSYIPIMNGCNNFCSYCIVPYVRGREVSRDTASIIEEVKFLDSMNVKEITLLGQNVNSYSSNYDGEEVDFPRLLELITPYMKNILWVRFESPHPKDFSDHLIDVIATNSKVSKHIHLPMQSGNSRILSLMNRHTTREKFIGLVESMYERIPSLTLATDVIVGFPTETEEEYHDTLSMMEIMHPTEAFMYYYNSREGTRAATMEGQLDEKTKIARLERLIREQLERQKIIRESELPLERESIITSESRDDKTRYLTRDEHNYYYSVEPLTKHDIGDVIKVRATELCGNTFRELKLSLYESFFTLIESSRRIVAFTGAGISTLSGIPDFRSAGGVYSKKFGSLNVEDILDIDFFMAHPEEYYAWAKTGWYGDEVYKPNIIHKVLKKMEDFGLLSEGVFTQNIDSLHTYCGSKKVYELHGTLRTSTCVICGRKYSFDETKRRMENLAYPVCECGGLLKSDIVFYGESLNGNILSLAYKAFGEADLAIVLGSSLVVNPAASLPYMTLQNGGKVVIVNRDRTYLDEQASFVFRDLREWGDEMDKFLEKRGQTIPS